MKKVNIIIIILGLSMSFFACDRERNDKGFEYFPDMAHSLTYESYAPNPNYDDNSTQRMPVEGTIPRGSIPYDLTKAMEDRAIAAERYTNPLDLKNDKESILLRGKEQYEIFCVVCHGDLGDGNGFLYESGKYPIQPASLVNERMLNARDGEFFHVITVGYGIMGAHGSMIAENDRWKIISYIREELQQGK